MSSVLKIGDKVKVKMVRAYRSDLGETHIVPTTPQIFEVEDIFLEKHNDEWCTKIRVDYDRKFDIEDLDKIIFKLECNNDI